MFLHRGFIKVPVKYLPSINSFKSRKMSSNCEVTYMNVNHVANLLDSDDNYKIIDVRDEDEYFEHIKGAINAESGQFYDSNYVESFVSTYRHTNMLIFHCLMSQKRGPRCARIVSEKFKAMNMENPPSIYIMEGGYSRWLDIYSGDMTKIEYTNKR